MLCSDTQCNLVYRYHLALVMQCKEEAKDCTVHFFTNGLNLSVFSIDTAFDLGAFSVTTTSSYQSPQWGEPCDDRAIADPPEEREGDIQHLYRLFAEFKTTAAKLASSWSRW